MANWRIRGYQFSSNPIESPQYYEAAAACPRALSREAETALATVLEKYPAGKLVTKEPAEYDAWRKSRPEEFAVWKEARDRLIDGTLWIVPRIASHLTSYGVPMEDLVAEGNLYLVPAVAKFDLGKNVRFSSYAALWALQGIERYVIANADVVRVSRKHWERMWKGNRAVREAATENDTDWDSLDAKGISRDAYEQSRSLVLRRAASMSPKTDDEENDNIAGPEEEDAVAEKDGRRYLHEFIDELPGREGAILRSRYLKQKTLEQVGSDLGVSRERARQLQVRGQTHLKELLELVDIGPEDF